MGKAAILIVLMLCVSYCSSDNNGEQNKKAGKRPTLKPKIARVDIDPLKPISTDIIRAIPRLASVRSKDYQFTYKWFVNDEAIEGTPGKLLEKKYYKKGDTVFCRVTVRRGKGKTEEAESPKITVGNAPPLIHRQAIPVFPIPGEFRYSIMAEDPDGDSLSYRLLAPLDKGIVVDSATGLMQWNVDVSLEDFEENPEPPTRPEEEGTTPSTKPPKKEKPSPIVKILYEVRDADGATSVSDITLNLAEGVTEIPQ